jgi:pilus assembly protein TadC
MFLKRIGPNPDWLRFAFRDLQQLAKSAESVDLNNNSRLVGLRKFNPKIEEYVGLLLEQIVLAVAAGLDVLPAMVRVVQVNGSLNNSQFEFRSANQIFVEAISFANSGMGLTDALKLVAKTQSSPLISSALMHLALAHKMGGELSRPLQDLSADFQDRIRDRNERSIQTIPLKATIPLLFVFAGMIILTLSIPVLKVVTVSKQRVAQS